MIDSSTLLVTVLICLPALAMAAQRSTWLVDYLFFVVALNRGIRRIVDYYNGAFNPYSLISLTSIVVGGLATLVVLIELNHRREVFGSRGLAAIIPYGIAVSMAFAVGFLNSRFASVYALGDYIAPIGLIGFGVLFADDDRVINRWCNSLALSVFVVGAYGIWQFYTIPPWDGFWLIASGMDGYMGSPEPQKMTLFSTMNERGPASSYLCGGLILLLLRPGTLSAFRWPVICVIAVAMLLTYTRTSVIQVASAVALYPILNRGASFLPMAVVILLIAMAGPQVLALLPGFEKATSRVATLGDLENDGSLQGRLRLFGLAAEDALTEPIGIGIGSHGLATKVAKANVEGVTDSTGYMKTLRTFGWVGFALICLVLLRCWIASRDLIRLDPSDKNALLFRAWFVSILIAFMAGDMLFTVTFFWVLAGYCLGRVDMLTKQFFEDDDSFVHDYDYDDEYQQFEPEAI